MDKLKKLHIKEKVFIVLILCVLSLVLVGCWGDSTTFTVIFDSCGGSTVESIEIKKGDKIPLQEQPTKYGYTFEGWHINLDLSTEWKLDKDTVTKNRTLYAKWKVDEEVVNDEKNNLLNNLQSLLLDYSEGNYSETNWAILTGYVTSAIANVNASTTVEEIATIDIDAVKANCDSVEMLSEELKNAMFDKVSELFEDLEQEYEKENYTPAGWMDLENIIIQSVKNATKTMEVKAISLDMLDDNLKAVKMFSSQLEDINTYFIENIYNKILGEEIPFSEQEYFLFKKGLTEEVTKITLNNQTYNTCSEFTLSVGNGNFITRKVFIYKDGKLLIAGSFILSNLEKASIDIDGATLQCMGVENELTCELSFAGFGGNTPILIENEDGVTITVTGRNQMLLFKITDQFGENVLNSETTIHTIKNKNGDNLSYGFVKPALNNEEYKSFLYVTGWHNSDEDFYKAIDDKKISNYNMDYTIIIFGVGIVKVNFNVVIDVL